MKKQHLIICLITIIFFLPNFTKAQNKTPINHSIYGKWKKIKNNILSNDGKWLAFEVNPEKGDGYLYIFNTEVKSIDSIPRGSTPSFSASGEFLIFKIKPQTDTIRKEKLAKKKDDDLSKDSLGIYILNKKTIIKIPRVKSFKLAKEKSSWIAYLLEKNLPKKDTSERIDTTINKENSLKEEEPKTKKQEGLILEIFNPITNVKYKYENISEYSISKEGNLIAFISLKKDSIDSTFVYTFNDIKEKFDTIFSSNGIGKKITIDKTGNQIGFIFTTDTSKTKIFNLRYWNSQNNKTKIIADTNTISIPKNWTVSEFGNLSFSDNGMKLYFGSALKPKSEPKDTLLDIEKVKLDLWSWHDKQLQSQQIKNLKSTKEKTYKAVYHTDYETIIQIEDSLIKNVRLANKGNSNTGLGLVNEHYEKAFSWESNRYYDVYVIDLITGNKHKILEKIDKYIYLSAKGDYILWYEVNDSSWYSYSVALKKTFSLTKNIKSIFYNEMHNSPDVPSSYGIAGWTKHDKEVLIYDRFDIWKIDPEMQKNPICISNRYGKNNKIKLRYSRINHDIIHIPSKILIKGFNIITRDESLYNLSISKPNNPTVLLNKKVKIYYSPFKAKNKNIIAFRMGNFKNYPDLYTTDNNFNTINKVMRTNPQQDKYLWGTVELVKWINFNGVEIEGLIYKPENFDSNKKYPMLVTFYERSSDLLHYHFYPKPSHSCINYVYCTSNDYVVFEPDVIYKTGFPGKSAYDNIVSGTMAMIEKGYIDKNKIGLQGQSWGGYQALYLITQTNLYKASMAGAPVSNMTSAYGGIRWGSGITRMFQYEDGQSRIGASLWDKPELYIENSPLFYADRINTPLMMMNNDGDGSVPWWQGIEMFVAMRRLDKPVWLLNYNGGQHNLYNWAYRVDFTKRLMQFFDHYLKDAPAPEWMTKGIPAIEKGINFGFDIEK